jgi:hypothetical protein
MNAAFRHGAVLYTVALLWSPSSLRAEGIPEPSLIFYGTVRNTAGGQNIRLTSGTLAWTFHPTAGGSDVVVTTQLTNLLDQFSYLLEVPCEFIVSPLTPSTNALLLTTPATTYVRTNVTLNGQLIFITRPAADSIMLATSERGRLERVDLTVNRPDADSDGDGLPDWWESQYFTDPNADPDGDGMNNLSEYRAGTLPNDPLSLFEFVYVEHFSSGETRVQWSSVAGRTYTVLRSTVLTNNASQFTVVQTGIVATPPVNTFLDPPSAGSGPYFYLLRVE